jgi:hypothetical protein
MLGSAVFAQTKETLYYDENWKGLDTKKKATYYRIVNYNKEGKPSGMVETFYMSGKPRSFGQASFIDKIDDTKTLWKNNRVIYSEKGVKLFDENFDEAGNAHGMSITFDEKGEKESEAEYDHGNPVKEYYLVYEKGEPVKYSFLTRTPLKLKTSGKTIVPITERKTIYQDGQPIQYYSFNGISVAVRFARDELYGDYYSAYITVENGTDKQFNLDPSEFTAVLGNKGKIEEVEILSYDYYIKKVNRRQSWGAAFNAFAQSQAASQAGYSGTVAAGAVVNNYGGAAVGVAASQSYSGAAQYAANQNASNNINKYNNQLYSIKESITQGYLKINTVFPSTRIIGYVNIKHQKADGILFNIPINGQVYQFGG